MLEDRGGELGRSPAMGFTLGVPGRGGARGNELKRPDGAGGDEGAEGIVGSLAAGGFASEVARAAADSGDDDLRLTGGGGGACELRAGASTSSMSASASTSDSSFGSGIISVIDSSRHLGSGVGHTQQNIS
jgi:hypothetical protein